jgi:hypothetical protein
MIGGKEQGIQMEVNMELSTPKEKAIVVSSEKGLVNSIEIQGLATFDEKKLELVASRMPMITRGLNTAGKKNTQTTSQLMTLTMLSDSPYRRLRQCLAEIDRKNKALSEVYYKLKKDKIKARRLEDKGDELSLVEAEEIYYNMEASKNLIDGALKEVGMFQAAYIEIMSSHSIPENWDERDMEEEEISHHLRMAFRNAYKDVLMNGVIGMGTMEYLEQYGVHPQTALLFVRDYIQRSEDECTNATLPSVTSLHTFLDNMSDFFSDSYKHTLDRIGLKDIIKDDFMYLEGKDDNIPQT